MPDRIWKLTVVAMLTMVAAAAPPSLGQVLEIDGHFRLSGNGGSAVNLLTGNNSTLQLQTESTSMSFLVDSNEDDADTTTHQFTWWLNNFQEASRGMQFTIRQGAGGDDGTLRVAGPVVSNGFDLAESFWMSEPIAPGQVVAVDPRRRDAVVPSNAAYDRRAVGVASARPALLMGGSAFSLEQLERTWGAQAVRLFESERAELEARILARVPHLAEESPIALFDRVMGRFFERHIVSVALAGRVPVLADASAGPIAPGDPLTTGPVPGTAMRADRPGPIIGHALETLALGQKTILALVQRGWFPGDPQQRDLMGFRPAGSPRGDAIARLRSEQRALLATRDLEIAELRQRLDRLARLVRPQGQEELAGMAPPAEACRQRAKLAERPASPALHSTE